MAKGFKRPERTVTVAIDEGDYAGAELTLVANPPWKVYREISTYLSPADPPALAPDADAETRKAHRREVTAYQREQLASLDGLITLLADHVLRAWNIVDHEDRPYPPNAEGLALQAPEFIGDLLAYWERVVTAPTPDFSNGSNGGEPTPAKKKRRQR